MGFLNALYIAGISLVIVPIILHLWRRRTEVVISFPAVKYLIRAQERFRRNIIFSDIFLMVLRGLIFVLLTLALSQPYTGNPFVALKEGQEGNVLLIDTSMSMCADGFIKKAKDLASEIVNQHTAEILIVTFNDSIDKFSRSTGGGRIIDELKCTYKGTDILRAIDEAADMLGEGEKFIYLITDMKKKGWDTERIARLLEEKHINLIIADVKDNLQPRNYFVRDFGVEEVSGVVKIRLRVGATSDSDEEIPVSLNLDDSTRLRTVTKAGEETEFAIHRYSSEKGFIELEGDELQEDNRYFFFLNIKSQPRILIIDGEPDIRPFRGESYFLLRAIEALREKFKADVTVLTPSGLKDFNVRNYNIFFLLNVPQIQRNIMDRIMEEVEKGAGLIFTSGNNTDINWFKVTFADKLGIIPKGIQEGEFHLTPIKLKRGFLDVSKRDEKFFRDIVFKKRIIFIPAESGIKEAVFYFSDGSPALIESVLGNGIVIIFASTIDADWTNFPLSGIFIPFIHDILVRLSAGAKPLVVKNILTGEHNIEFTGIVDELTLVKPHGERSRVKAQNNSVRIDLNLPGIWRLGDYILTVNTDIEESEMVDLDREELQRIESKRIKFYEGNRGIGRMDAFNPLWQYFIIIFGLFVVMESILSSRGR